MYKDLALVRKSISDELYSGRKTVQQVFPRLVDDRENMLLALAAGMHVGHERCVPHYALPSSDTLCYLFAESETNSFVAANSSSPARV